MDELAAGTECTRPELPPGHEVPSGFADSRELVCSACVVGLAEWMAVFEVVDDGICGRCTSAVAPFAEERLVFEHIYRCLCQEFRDPTKEWFWDGRDDANKLGIDFMDTLTVLDAIGNPFGDSMGLASEFDATVDHRWYRGGSETAPDEAQVLWGWDDFVKRLQSGPRFLFSLSDPGTSRESPQRLLEYLGELASNTVSSYVKTTNAGRVLYRARWHETEHFTDAADLGSPPPAIAGPQRMSAAGVSCFYAAEEPSTAIAEVVDESPGCISVGRWETTQQLKFADFASELETPSLFDYPASKHRADVVFLREFVERISCSSDEYRGDANAYLGTQVLAEYFRYLMPVGVRRGVDAIRYPSTARRGGINWVIFGQPDQDDPPVVEQIAAEHH